MIAATTGKLPEAITRMSPINLFGASTLRPNEDSSGSILIDLSWIVLVNRMGMGKRATNSGPGIRNFPRNKMREEKQTKGREREKGRNSVGLKRNNDYNKRAHLVTRETQSSSLAHGANLTLLGVQYRKHGVLTQSLMEHKV